MVSQESLSRKFEKETGGGGGTDHGSLIAQQRPLRAPASPPALGPCSESALRWAAQTLSSSGQSSSQASLCIPLRLGTEHAFR